MSTERLHEESFLHGVRVRAESIGITGFQTAKRATLKFRQDL